MQPEFQSGFNINCPACQRAVFVMYPLYCPHCGQYISTTNSRARKPMTIEDFNIIRQKMESQAIPKPDYSWIEEAIKEADKEVPRALFHIKNEKAGDMEWKDTKVYLNGREIEVKPIEYKAANDSEETKPGT